MNYKYWLLLSLAPVAAALPAACSGKFDTCEARRKCPVGTGGAKASNDGSSAGEAGDQQPNSEGGSGGVDETSGGAAGETADGAADGGTAGEGGESGGDICVPGQPACDGNRATTCNADGTGYSADGLKCSSKQTCLAGACEDQECSPSERFCSGKSVRQVRRQWALFRGGDALWQ